MVFNVHLLILREKVKGEVTESKGDTRSGRFGAPRLGQSGDILVSERENSLNVRSFFLYVHPVKEKV